MSFVVYCVSMVGETNRAPFDLAEAEGELVGGFNTEYSSMRFGLFFLAEYINLINVSAIATTLFLGGWRAPWPVSLLPWANEGYWTLLWFFIKVLLFMFVFVWLRGTLPRIRYDQFMSIGWKVLIPVSLVWIVLVGAVRVLRNAEGFSTTEVLLWVGIPLAILLIAALPGRGKNPTDDDEADGRLDEAARRRPSTASTAARWSPEALRPLPGPAAGPEGADPADPGARAADAAAPAGTRRRRRGAGAGTHELPGGSDVVS